MSMNQRAMTVLGLRLRPEALAVERSITLGSRCSCPENDFSKKFCCQCGNSNEEKIEHKVVPLACVTDDGTKIDGKWRIYQRSQEMHQEDDVYVCAYIGIQNGPPKYVPQSCVPCPLSMEQMSELIKKFESDMRDAGLWGYGQFGLYTIFD